MTPERWLRLEELFDAAVELPSSDRAALLDRECADDLTLRRQVESLIISSDKAGTFINAAVHGAARMVAETDPITQSAQQIGPYRVVRELGHGGMGAVYLAVRADDEYQKQVAIKLVRSGLQSSELLRRFRGERQILASLDHPCIARLLDGGTADTGSPYVVMEYVKGEPIDTYCDRNRLTTGERLGLFRKVCSAVQYAHQNLIVHRDIKPSNIMVTAEGEPKLLDFGIAKLLSPDTSLQTIAQTRTDVRLMTPDYASPEQVRGEPISTASDTYSLGIVLYELLTGRRPYRFQTYQPAEMERVICEQAPERPSTAVTRGEKSEPATAGVGEAITARQVGERRRSTTDKLKRQLRGDLDNIVMKALNKEPSRRYASVEQFSEDIARHLNRLPVIARPDTIGYRARKFVGRHRAGVFATTVVVVLIVALVGFYTWRLAGERDRAQLEAAKAAKVSEFLTGLFEVSDPSQSKGETITARELLDRGAIRVENELSDQPEVHATMMDVMGRVYRTLGLYGRGKDLLERGLVIRKQVLGEDDLQVAESLFNLGELLHYQNKIDEAEPLYRQALEIRRRHYGPENLAVAKTIDLLGRVNRDRGNYDEAERLHLEALSIRRKMLGEETLEVSESLRSMGMVLDKKGDYNQAETYFRQELAILQKLGKEDPSLLFNLANVLGRKGDHQSALEFHRETLTLTRKIYGEEHPFVAHALEGLALAIHGTGDADSAEPLLRDSLEIRRKVAGEESPDFALSLNNLARVLNAKGDFEQAEPLFRQALTIYGKVVGPEHPRVTDVKSNLGQLLYEKGDYPEAERMCREALALDRKLLGEEHPFVAADKYHLARALRAMGDLKTAESLFREALETQKKLPEGQSRLVSTMIGLGGVLNESNQHESAETILREALNLKKKVSVEPGPETAEAESELGHLLARQSRFDEAEPLLVGSYQVLKATKGEKSRQTTLALERLINLYKAWDRPRQAAQYSALQAKQNR